MSWKAGILASCGTIIAKLAGSRALEPHLPDDFFKNPKYQHLVLRNVEIDDLFAYCRGAVEREFGPESVERILLERAIARDWKYDPNSLFSGYLDWITDVKSVIEMFPDSRLEKGSAAVTNIHVAGNVIGSTVAGANASNNSNTASNIGVDSARAKEALELLEDLFQGKNLTQSDRQSLDAAKTQLGHFADGASKDLSLVQRVVATVSEIGGRVLSSASSSLLVEAVKRIMVST